VGEAARQVLVSDCWARLTGEVSAESAGIDVAIRLTDAFGMIHN